MSEIEEEIEKFKSDPELDALIICINGRTRYLHSIFSEMSPQRIVNYKLNHPEDQDLDEYLLYVASDEIRKRGFDETDMRTRY